jgi:hypothetical protein
MFTLKKGIQGFTVIDGGMSGKSFKPGVAYEEIPPQETAKFEEIKDAKPDETQASAEAAPDAGGKQKKGK